MSRFGNQLRRTIPMTGVMMVTFAVVACHCHPARASQLQELAVRAGVHVIAAGTSTDKVEQSARNSIPLNRLTSAGRQRVAAVLDNTSQYRRLPEVRYAVDGPMYRYLVQHPDVAVSTWRALGISRFKMWQTGTLEYEAEAGDGSEGIADILYRDRNHCLFICAGKYHNPLLPKAIEAAALVWFQYSFTRDVNGVESVHQTADVFVTFPSQGISTIAKVLSPVTNALLDRNLYEVTLYACMMSRAVSDEPEWVVQLARQLDGVLPSRPGELIAIAQMQRKRRNAVRPRRGVRRISATELQSRGIQLFEPPHNLMHAGLTRPKPATRVTAVPIPPSSLPLSFPLPKPNGETAPGRTVFVQSQHESTVWIRPAARVVSHTKDAVESDEFVLQESVLPGSSLSPAADDRN
jgi:hypothetical protein